MIEAIICDLDGTLCDTRHRQYYMQQQPKMREQFHAACVYDPANPPVLDILNGTSGITYIVSARPETYREQTERWLRTWNVRCHTLLMRAEGDTRPDPLVKLELYRNNILGYSKIGLVLEDKPDVVAMWRGIGLQCWQVQI